MPYAVRFEWFVLQIPQSFVEKYKGEVVVRMIITKVINHARVH